MLYLIFIVILILIGILCLVFKVSIDFKSIFRPGKWLKSSEYGLRDISGVQGSGKTSFCIHKMKQYEKKYILFANVPNINNINYTYFNGFEGLFSIVTDIDNGLYQNNEKHQFCIFFDELFSELTKSSKSSKEIIKVLCQLRKRHIILLTTCQSFPELPLWFRRLCRYEIEIHNFPLLSGSYFLAVYKNGYKLKWDEIKQDFDAPVVVTKIEKCSRKLLNSYNTDEVIASGTFKY